MNPAVWIALGAAFVALAVMMRRQGNRVGSILFAIAAALFFLTAFLSGRSGG